MGGWSSPGSCPSRTLSSLGACLGETFTAHACPFAEPEPVRGARLDVGATEAHSEEGGGDPGRRLLPHPAAAPREAGQVSGHSAGRPSRAGLRERLRGPVGGGVGRAGPGIHVLRVECLSAPPAGRGGPRSSRPCSTPSRPPSKSLGSTACRWPSSLWVRRVDPSSGACVGGGHGRIPMPLLSGGRCPCPAQERPRQ